MNRITTENKQLILDKYTQGDHKTLLILDDGGEVIAEASDEQNKLQYIIRRNGKISLEAASKKVIMQRFPISHKIRAEVHISADYLEKKQDIPKP